MRFEQHLLDNGLQIVGETNPSARSMAIGFFVRAGARDEEKDVSGVTHFLEHMIFKGTPRRTALKVNQDFDRIGADYNAYTSEENTVFHAAILPEYMEDAVDLLADILRPSIREADFDMEKNVIIEEIGMYDDHPMQSAFEKAQEAHFADHPLGKSVLGTVESIQALRCEQMRAYFEKHYVAPNIVAAAAGNFSWDKFVALITKHCQHWNSTPCPRADLREAKGSGVFRVIHKDKFAQENVILISAGPPVRSMMRYPAAVLATIVGDDTGSRLHWELTDPGKADSAFVSYAGHEDCGAFYSGYSCEPEMTQENLGIMRDVLDRVHKDGVTEQELEQAKNKILSQIVRASEYPNGRMRALGRSWTYLGEYRSMDDELRDYDAVTLESIREVLDQYPFDNATTFALGPLTELQG